jgi:tRNA (guanine-N7-)-methyltransferase
VLHPPQRSFKPRRRGLSASRLLAYERASAKWRIEIEGPMLDLADLFGRHGDVVLDIGFGGGEALIERAEVRPDEQVIGIDVHTPGVARVMREVESRGLANVRVAEGDVVELLARLPLRSLAGIRVFYPDPWPKQRQRGRRLIRAENVAQLAARLDDGGCLHLATDDDDYAAQMRQVCDATAGLTGGFVERPSWRPTTRFERRAIDAGRRSTDLVYLQSIRASTDDRLDSPVSITD